MAESHERLSNGLPDIPLCEVDDATFWPWVTWPDIANWPDKESTLVVIPIAGLADWGLGHSLDAEETVLMAVLRETSLSLHGDGGLLVIPPLRFTVGPEPSCAFSIDPDVACDFLEEVASSIGNSGFTKIVFLNASPWMEEVCKAVSRDLRIHQRLQMFGCNLSALGLDFHPVRGGDRAVLRGVLQALGPGSQADEAAAGRALLSAAAERLKGLFLEMREKPPLANDGALPTMTWP